MKTYISKKDWKLFREWLVNVVGVQVVSNTNCYELLRWKHLQKGKPMPIAFRRDKTDKITLNGEANRFYVDYKRRIGNQAIQ